MKINIITEKYRFKFWFPTSIIKCKFIWKIVIENIKDKKTCESIMKNRITFYKQLKKWRKVNGKLTILHIETSDNYRIEIII